MILHQFRPCQPQFLQAQVGLLQIGPGCEPGVAGPPPRLDVISWQKRWENVVRFQPVWRL